MRPIVVRGLFTFSCICLASGAAVHGLAYNNAAQVVRASNLSEFFAKAFMGLWLSDSINLLALALAFGALAFRPHSGSNTVIGILAAAPIGSAVTIYMTLGGFFAAHVLLAAGVAALAATVLRDHTSAAEFRTRGESMASPNRCAL